MAQLDKCEVCGEMFSTVVLRYVTTPEGYVVAFASANNHVVGRAYACLECRKAVKALR
jgi:hypothetical protein